MRSSLVAGLVSASLFLAPLAAMAETPSPAPMAEAIEAVEPVEDDPYLQAETVQRERREAQLAWHQGLAIGALVAMVTTGILGKVLTSQKADPKVINVDAIQAAHVISATTTTLLYGSAATLALTAPPPTQTAIGSGGFDPIVLHRGLSVLHAATLGATVALGLSSLFQVPGLTGAHQALAFATTGLMAISGGLIVFNF
jgi:hypothetical protein